MIYTPSDDQVQILESLRRMTDRFAAVGIEDVVRNHVYAEDLRSALEDAGFLDLALDDREAATTAGLILAELSKLPVALELTGTLFVRPAVAMDMPGPVALIWGDSGALARFLPQARTACIVAEGAVRIVELGQGDVEPVESLFAYPMGRLAPAAVSRARPLPASSVALVTRWWQIGIALELYGALDGAFRLTLNHVVDRKQFGRPLGTFQAVQHRLAMSASAIEGIRWLAFAAIASRSQASAALAAGHAQQVCRDVIYNLHQFSGAMGLTLEYPLHLYTYRAKFLQSELGGALNNFAAAADEIWPEKHALECKS